MSRTHMASTSNSQSALETDPSSFNERSSIKSEKPYNASDDTTDSSSADLEQGIQDQQWHQTKSKAPLQEVPWEEDPMNAHNWSTLKRVYHTLIPAGAAFICTLASSIYTPGIDGVRQTFHVSNEVALLPFSLYVLGLAFGPTISAPMSETFGRRIVYRVATPIFLLFTLGAGFSTNIWTLTVLRFFAGVFGSPTLSIGSAMIADIWPLPQRALPMSSYVATPFMGPALGPLLGGYATMGKDWRWTMWVTLFFAVVCAAPMYIGMQETYKKTILATRAEKRRKENGEPKPKRSPIIKQLNSFVEQSLTRPLQMLFLEPIPGLFALYVGFNFAVQYSFFAAFPLVFSQSYGFDLGQIGLTFLGLGVGVLIGYAALLYFNIWKYKPWVIEWKKEQTRNATEAEQRGEKPPTAKPPPPEWRLYLAFPGSVIMPMGLFLFAWTAGRTHWILPVIGEALFGISQLLIFMSATMYVTDCYGPLYAASAMSANTMTRYVLGTAFPLFAVQMYEGLGTDWATSLLGFVSCVLALIPWCFWHWGPRLRAVTRFKQGD